MILIEFWGKWHEFLFSQRRKVMRQRLFRVEDSGLGDVHDGLAALDQSMLTEDPFTGTVAL